ncbi:AraC family transcriptional regulator N-terminal domain-containing protein [Shewanella intestini]|uniref:AraC family transcriptional regulator n=1 Tax=Shewanella intestini TaxID=2017544 RepID=A0ABS5HZ51_9GAMM|nr:MULTISPECIES: AraC family transcriptional regulator [Shewanella]MBR9727021.1 AraC family transcriptional regulator [Shewanella intestini]MRG35822.1 helix-turn-helix domain-containing protein [Shewanella sp. XMDDZSB0408]
MQKSKIKHLIEQRVSCDGLIETGIKGVQLFRLTQPHQCTPVIYEPMVIAIVSGAKQAILDGKQYLYDAQQYMCCSLSIPVEAGTATASPQEPLLGVCISLDTKVLTELTIEMETVAGRANYTPTQQHPPGLALANWDEPFTDALLRLLQLGDNKTDCAILGNNRLREVYYALLNGDAGATVKQAFGVGNDIARTIEVLSSQLDKPITIEDIATQVGMSRAVLHRKFKQATTMSPMQFIKSMRLNSAAVSIAKGMNVSEAAMQNGYVSASQFSREFKRLFGQTPKQWRGDNKQLYLS